MKRNAVEMKFAGIDFLLDINIDSCDGAYCGLFGVEVWNDKKHAYDPLPCVLEDFEKYFKDQIDEAVEEWKLNNRLAAEDLAYDVMMGK